MPSQHTDSTHFAALCVLSAAVLLYAILIMQQILLGTLLVGFVWFGYVVYLLFAVLTRIAVAVERLADQREERNR